MRHASVIPVIVLLVTAFGSVVTPPPRLVFSSLAYDTYSYFLAHAMYAARAVHEDAGGLLWNPFQNCGQPFFANPLTGLLYPPHLLFLILAPDVALHAVTVVNLAIAGIDAYLLARQIG